MDIRESLGKVVKKKIKGEDVNVLMSAVIHNNEMWTYAKAWFDLDNGLLFTPDKSRLLIEGQDYYYKNNQLLFY